MTEKEQLIEAWTRNLEDNAEHQMHAIGLLTDEIDDNAVSLPVVSAMLQKVTPQARVKRRRVMWALSSLAVLLSLFSILSLLRMRSSVTVLNSLLNFGPSDSIRVQTSTPQEERLLYGDLSQSTAVEQRRALWEDEPNNPAYFAEYSLHFIEGRGVVPPDFLKIAAEIDPDNAWFPAIAASTKAKDVCKKEKLIHPLSPVTPASISLAPIEERQILKSNIVYEYSVVHAAGMQEALDLWRQSLKLGTYNSYEIVLQQKRYPLLSQRANYISYLPPIQYVFSHPHSIRQRYLCDVLATALQQTDMRSDEGKQLILDIESYTQRLVSTEPTSLIDILVTRAILMEIYKQIDVIDTSALDQSTVAEWKRRKEALQALNKTLQQSNNHHDELLRRHASLLTSLALPLATKRTTSPPPLNVNDLKPMRYVDHCLFLSLLAIICSLLMVSLIPNHFWISSRKMVHRISEEAWHSIRWRSIVMLVLLSVVAPLAYYTLLTLWTPLTGKHLSAGLGFIFPLYPAISVVLLLLLLPRLLVHRFIAPWQQLSSHRSHWYMRLGWIACLLPLLPLHLLSLFMTSNTHATVLFAMVGICWVPAILWLLWTLGRGLFAKGFYQAAMHGLRRRVVATCTISSIILLTVAYGMLYKCGSYWIQKDTIMAISPDKLSLTYEAELIRRAHEDLLGIMKQQ